MRSVGWVEPRGGLDGVEKKKALLPGGNQSAGLPARSLVSVLSSDKSESKTKITVAVIK